MKILLVEDHPDLAEITSMILEDRFDYEVEWVDGGGKAIEAAGRFEPDLILVDISLPDMSGYEVAQKLRRSAKFAKTTLVALSGFDEPEMAEKARDAGFDAFYTKPMDLTQLSELHRAKVDVPLPERPTDADSAQKA